MRESYTIFIGIIDDVEVLVLLQSCLKQLDLGIAFDPLTFHLFRFYISTFSVQVCLVELRHLVYSTFVLSLYLKFELELMKHPRYLSGRKRGIGFDQICTKMKTLFEALE